MTWRRLNLSCFAQFLTLGEIHTDTTLFLGLGLLKKTQIAKIHSDGAPNICRTILRRKSHFFCVILSTFVAL
uniref:Putative secreted protein n=1 Tax=Rhipicephalus microplus TaxID=6941 RepID=A0A6M2DCE9_RHIMP